MIIKIKNNKNILKYIIFFYAFFLLFPISKGKGSPADPYYVVKKSELNSVLEEFVHQIDIDINIGSLREKIDKLFDKDGTLILNNKNLQLVVEKLRSLGLPLGCYFLNEVNDLKKITSSFIVISTEGLFVVYNREKKYYILDFSQGVYSERELSFDELSKLANNNPIITFPYSDIRFKIKNISNYISNRKFFIIYSYHDEENFQKLKNILNDLRNRAIREDKKLVYIDELGLIPKDSVENRMRRQNVTQEEAFNQIKQSIFREDEMLEEGIPLNIGSNFYRQLYKWLAKYRIKSLVENLRYSNWKDIVKFDDLKLNLLAKLNFYNYNLKKYIRYKRTYCEKFWLYNVKKRDKNFVAQVQKLVLNNPDNIYFTLRGIGHYGLEESFIREGIDVEFIVIGKGRLENNLINQQVYQIYSTFGVAMSSDEKVELFLPAQVQECIRGYFYDVKKMSTLESTLKTNDIMEKLDYEDIFKISKAIEENFKNGNLKEFEDVYEFVYDWCKNKGFVE